MDCLVNLENDGRKGEVHLWFKDCNLSCTRCLYADKRESGNFFDFKELKIIFDNINSVYLSGGEPLGCGDLISFLFSLRKNVKFVSLKTNGTFPDKLKRVVSWWLVDRVELWINGPITMCEQYCGVVVNYDLFIASLTTLMNWAGEQEIKFVIWDYYPEQEFNMMADLLEGVRSLTLVVRKGISLSEELENKFKVVAGELKVEYF